MAITLKLQHTFSTRVVFRTEEIVALRTSLERYSKHRQEFAKQLLAMPDEDLVFSLFKDAYKDVREFVLKETKPAGVTRMSPIQTQKVK